MARLSHIKSASEFCTRVGGAVAKKQLFAAADLTH